MKILKLALLAAAASLAVGSAAHAQAAAEAPAVALAFNLGVASDYVFRGITQTDENPQIYGGVDATIGKAYVGFWTSNVDFGNDTSAEFDIYGGFKPTLGAVSLDIGLIYYGYANKPAGPDEAYWEAKLAGSVAAGTGTIGGAIYYSPEFFGETGTAVYYEGNASFPIPNTKLSVSGALGYQWFDAGGSYTTWNLGMGFAATDHLSFDLRYIDSNDDVYGTLSDARVVLGAKVVF
jgi:uncharacterized protein (TIGR02001 family)